MNIGVTGKGQRAAGLWLQGAELGGSGENQRGLAFFFVTTVPLFRLLLSSGVSPQKCLRMMLFPAKQHVLQIYSMFVKWRVCLRV